MSTMSEAARAAAKAKAERLVRADPHARVDASGYMPDGAMDADVKTGLRPVSRRQYASGGGVAGGAGAARADRKPRASGGRTLTADSLANTDIREANGDRAGIKHDGGFARGGLPSAGKSPFESSLEMPKAMRSGKPATAKDAYKAKTSAERRSDNPHTGTAYGGWDRDDMKSGGRTGKMAGGALSPQQRMALQQRATIPSMTRPVVRAAGGKVHASGCECAKCGGGRVGKARGGPAINDGTRPVSGRMARAVGGKLGPASRQEPGSGDNNGKYRNDGRIRNHYRDLRDSALLAARTGPEKDKNENVAYAKRMQSNVIRSLKSADGGRIARKSGGRTKKGTTVNINIVQPPQRPPMPPMGVRPPPPAGPVGMRQGMPPAGTMMPPPGAQGIPPAAPLTPRASGGRATGYPIDAGSGGGQARLEKAARAAKQ